MKPFLSLLFVILLVACAVPTLSPPTPAPSVTGAPPPTSLPVPAVTVTPPPTMPAIQPAAAPLPFPADALSAAILNPTGFVRLVHDPVITKAGDTYYLFSTGAGIRIRCSKDLEQWEYCGIVFDRYPDWIRSAVPHVLDLWAPDISFYSGVYHLYYSGSTFGSNRSVIGLATNVTLDPKDPRYKWEDKGQVIASQPENDYNTIDPNLAFDRAGQPWLAFGSYWSGIKLVQLDPATGKPPDGAKLFSIASKPGNDAIEGSFIVRRGDFFYLFVSHDFCCRGIDSTYNIRVGRAAEITGPYTDREGKPMLGGGGTLVYAGSDRWRGPGHNAILIDNETYYLVYHSYDRNMLGDSFLRIEKLFWDADGWPLSPSQLLGQ